MYFNKFPSILYDFDIGSKTSVIQLKDITRNIRFRRDVLANITIYDEYDIMDGDTPELIAEKLYGNAQYHWIVMLINEVYDYRKDWVLSQYDLDQYITKKYGSAKYDVHHYTLNGFIVDSDTAGASSVSNYDYEIAINESKRRIKIVPKYLIDKILTEYKSLM